MKERKNVLKIRLYTKADTIIFRMTILLDSLYKYNLCEDYKCITQHINIIE